MDTLHSIDASELTRLGFRVEPAPTSGHRAYKIYGPRGGEWTLWRNARNPERLFLVDSSGKAYRHPVLGMHFLERGGKLRRCVAA